MKIVGLVGGVTWASSLDYYRIINEEVNRRRGGLTFAECVLYSLDYGEIAARNAKADAQGVCDLLVGAARKLEAVGAQCLLLCANTMHMHAERVQEAIRIPLLHIGDATAREIKKRKITTVALLGTRPTMELDFYRERLRGEGIATLVPPPEDRRYIHQVIESELVHRRIVPETKARFLGIIDALRDRGAEGVILGCTEIPILIGQGDTPLPVFDTTRIHSLAAVEFALS